MFVSRNIVTHHSDLIHDIAYDYYGRRMVTVSSDQMIKVWDLREDGEWVCTARWRNHLGPIWRVSWAHPEFGQVIATCSFDRSIIVWEEITGHLSGQSSMLLGPSDASCGGGGWVRRANLVDPRTSVTGLQFAPRHMGLQLAAVSTDGILRIYEAQDVMNLSQWTLQCDIGTKMVGSCLAWSQSRLDAPLIAVGSSASESGLDGDAGSELPGSGGPGTGGAASHGVRGKIVFYEYRRGWELVDEVSSIREPVYDVAFAPHMGQSYHMLAVGAAAHVYVMHITPAASLDGGMPLSAAKSDSTSSSSATGGGGGGGGGNNVQAGAYLISVVARFDQHIGRVWRVSWNITGSLLASSGDDGIVRLWQSNYLGVWQPVAELLAPTQPAPAAGTVASTATANTVSAAAAAVATGQSTVGQQQQQSQQQHHLSLSGGSGADGLELGQIEIRMPAQMQLASNLTTGTGQQQHDVPSLAGAQIQYSQFSATTVGRSGVGWR